MRYHLSDVTQQSQQTWCKDGRYLLQLRCVFVYFIEDLDTFASTKEAQNNMYDGVVYLILFFHYLVCI